jgi:hypothetical protein
MGRDKFIQALNEGKIQEIIDSIKELENAIIEYRKSSYYGVGRKTSGDNVEEILEEKNIQQLETHQVIDLDEYFEGRERQLKAQIEIPPKQK